MATNYAKRVLERFIELFASAKIHTYNKIISNLYFYKAYIRYDALPRQEYTVSPNDINYDISDEVKEYYNWSTRYPPHIILGGNWDKLKENFEKKWIYKSYIQRYEENQPWKETEYYISYRRKGYTHEATMEKLRVYDKIYNDMKKNGYDDDQPIKVYIGRNGEYMRVTGQNRLCIAKVLGLDSIPVQIELVHKQWQEIREEIFNTGFSEEYKDLRGHPDLQDIFD